MARADDGAGRFIFLGDTIMRWLEKAATVVGGLCLATLVAIMFSSVVARYALGRPIAWTEELAGLLMVWIVMIAAVAAEARNEHLTIDLIEHYLPASARRGLAIAIGALSIGLLLVMGWYGWVLAEMSTMRRTQILRISWFWLYLPVAIGAVLLAIVTVLKLLGHQPDPENEMHEVGQ